MGGVARWAGRADKTKGVKGRTMARARRWNWSETACLRGRRPPGPRRNLQRHTGKGFLQKHTHTHTLIETNGEQ